MVLWQARQPNVSAFAEWMKNNRSNHNNAVAENLFIEPPFILEF